MNDLVSIITPCYNSAKFLKETIDSVLIQTYPYWEMIIIDDNSRDSSREIIEGVILKENRIKSIYLNENIGPAAARNVGFKEAKGKYIAFLDSDDLWMSNKLEEQIAFMQTNKIAFSFTTYTRINEKGDKRLSTIVAPKLMSYDSYLFNTIIGCLTVILDREEIGDFKMQDLRSSHDMVLWLEIMKKGFNAYGLNQDLAQYRVVKTSNTAQKWKAALEVWIIYRTVEKLSVSYSLYYFFGYVFHAIKKRL